MKLLNKDRLMIKKVERIAMVIPKNKVTLVLGLPGTGKTTSILKALISDEIKPIWFNYDESDTPLDIDNDIDMFSGEYVLPFINGEIEDINDRVVVIDTYERFWEQIVDSNSKKDRGDKMTHEELKHAVVTFMEERTKDGITIIIIAHPEEYVGRDGIFKDNPVLARRAYEIISFEKRLSTSVKDLKSGNAETNFMYLKKARAFNGKTTYVEWMR